MQFVIIESFNGTVSLVTDDYGDTKIFKSLILAQNEAAECQSGIVVPLATDLIPTLIDTLDFVGSALFELDECEEEDGEDSIECRLGRLLQSEDKIENNI